MVTVMDFSKYVDSLWDQTEAELLGRLAVYEYTGSPLNYYTYISEVLGLCPNKNAAQICMFIPSLRERLFHLRSLGSVQFIETEDTTSQKRTQKDKRGISNISVKVPTTLLPDPLVYRDREITHTDCHGNLPVYSFQDLSQIDSIQESWYPQEILEFPEGLRCIKGTSQRHFSEHCDEDRGQGGLPVNLIRKLIRDRVIFRDGTKKPNEYYSPFDRIFRIDTNAMRKADPIVLSKHKKGAPLILREALTCSYDAGSKWTPIYSGLEKKSIGNGKHEYVYRKSFTDPSNGKPHTFHIHFGDKDLQEVELIVEYFEYCALNDYDKVGSLYGRDNREELLNEMCKVTSSDYTGIPDYDADKVGYVYCIRETPSLGESSLGIRNCKIGHVGPGREPDKRIPELDTGNFRLDKDAVIFFCPGDPNLEKKLHGIFSSIRLKDNKEWFSFRKDYINSKLQEFSHKSDRILYREAHNMILQILIDLTQRK